MDQTGVAITQRRLELELRMMRLRFDSAVQKITHVCPARPICAGVAPQLLLVRPQREMLHRETDATVHFY